MKTATVKCEIQFEMPTRIHEKDMHKYVTATLDIINSELQRSSLDNAPQILTGSIKKEDIVIVNVE